MIISRSLLYRFLAFLVVVVVTVGAASNDTASVTTVRIGEKEEEVMLVQSKLNSPLIRGRGRLLQDIDVTDYIAIVVNAPSGLNVRDGPGTNYKIIDGIWNGQQVTVTHHSVGNWAKIRYVSSKSKIGYVYLDYLESLIDVPNYNAIVYNAPSGLNVRNGPGTDQAIIDAL